MPASVFHAYTNNVPNGTHDPNDAWAAFRNQETKSVMMSRNINTVTDMIATLTKK